MSIDLELLRSFHQHTESHLPGKKHQESCYPKHRHGGKTASVGIRFLEISRTGTPRLAR